MGNYRSKDLAWDFYNCEHLDGLSDANLKEAFDELIRGVGLTLMPSGFCKFGGGGEGVSYIAIIGESHVAIHTWPEDALLQLTIDYCNHSSNNDKKVEKLLDHFKEFFRPCRILPHPPRYRGGAQ